MPLVVALRLGCRGRTHVKLQRSKLKASGKDEHLSLCVPSCGGKLRTKILTLELPGRGVRGSAVVIHSIIRPRLGRTSNTPKRKENAPRAPRAAPHAPRNTSQTHLGHLEQHLMNFETQANSIFVTLSSTSCTSKHKPNAPRTAEEGDKSNPNYAVQKPSERANNETSADFARKVHFANPKIKPFPV